MMHELVAARLQMALSLGFHIVFACIGIAMPFLMATSHWLYLRTRQDVYRTLTKAWSKGVAIFFAVGAGIVAVVLLGWYGVQYPLAVRFAASSGARWLTFHEAAAPAATLHALSVALLVGCALIFPPLGYLLKVFKWQTLEQERIPTQGP